MHAQTVLFSAAALATTALAQFHPMITSLAARQNSDAAGCMSKLKEFVSGMPTPTGELSSFVSSYASAHMSEMPQETDPCVVVSAVPSDLRGDYAAYDSQVISWYTASGSQQANDLATACASNSAEIAQVTSALAAMPTTEGACGITESPNAALPRPTGVIAGAAAGAAFIGAVAML